MSDLPPPTREVSRLARLIGPEPTLALVERWGGTRLYVPSPIPEGHEIWHVVGVDAARYLAERYGHGQMMVPVARRWRVLVYRARGMSYAQIARAVGGSERSVYRILSETEGAIGQMDFFDRLI
ncbi:helix-turn-helix domain-containing protein [Xanthobacter autotrophicus]|uniref:helix-turn-helix domain-containing protein n=1 Tax=Xanthobacter TaxID=279 RepID=UPI0024AB1386|nr:helix-turn-helix domain-containing protein [Xanthobacter autotrophicus]MDI4664694.1 helix-turn-helix domain-containing protein [Xanthobacter autotrophicus]